MVKLSLSAIVLVLWLAACGTGNREITIRTEGMRFISDEVRVKAGQPVTLRVVNQDGYAHAFDIDELDIHAQLPAQATFAVVFSPTAPGRYRFYCGSPGHAAAGMTGVFVVEP